MPTSELLDPQLETSGDRAIAPAPALPTVVYTPESPLRHPIRLVQQLVADLWTFRELIGILFLRDLKAMYRQSFLGYAWIFAPPLATTAVWMFLNSQRVVTVSETPIPYPVYVLIGTTLWAAFADAVVQPLSSFDHGKAVFMKLKVPAEAFIAAGMGRVVFDFGVRLLLLIPMIVMLGVTPSLTALLFPIAVFCLLLLGTAVGTMLVPLGSLYQDVKRGMGLLLGFVMYLSPVVYPPLGSGWAAKVVDWNPVTPMIMTARDWLTLGPSEYVASMLTVTCLSTGLLFVAAILLRVAMPHLVARMGM